MLLLWPNSCKWVCRQYAAPVLHQSRVCFYEEYSSCLFSFRVFSQWCINLREKKKIEKNRQISKEWSWGFCCCCCAGERKLGGCVFGARVINLWQRRLNTVNIYTTNLLVAHFFFTLFLSLFLFYSGSLSLLRSLSPSSLLSSSVLSFLHFIFVCMF